MASYSISIPVAQLIPQGLRVDAGTFQTLGYAVKAIAEAAQAQWVEYAQGKPLPDGRSIRRRTPDYATSIQLQQTGDFSARVYSLLPEAEGIETGMPARDLKRMLQTSAKVRLNAKGGRYLIIPFRHDTPGTNGSNQMPQAVHGWWQGKTPSAVTGVGTRPSQVQPGVSVPARTYAWGDKLKKGDLAALGVTGTQAKRMVGMVQFRKPGGTGGGAHSQYMTFRTMSDRSKGWIVPAKPGYYVAKTVAEQLKPVAEKAFAKAIEEDIRRALGG